MSAPGRLKFNVLPQHWNGERPRFRGDCEPWTIEEAAAYRETGETCRPGGFRPCPWVSCRHHLAIDVRENYQGKIRAHFAGALDGDLSGMKETCSLDVAEEDAHTLEEVAQLIGVTRQRVEAIEHVAQGRARAQRLAGQAKVEWQALLTRR